MQAIGSQSSINIIYVQFPSPCVLQVLNLAGTDNFSIPKYARLIRIYSYGAFSVACNDKISFPRQGGWVRRDDLEITQKHAIYRLIYKDRKINFLFEFDCERHRTI